MKILYLVTGIRSPAASGSEFIQNLIFEISKNGVSATVISPIYIHTEKNMASWVAEKEKKYNIKFILIDVPTFIKKIFLLHLIITPLLTTIVVVKLLFKEKFDAVHEFTSTPAIIIRSLVYKCFNIPSIFTLAVLNKTILGKLFWFKILDFGSAYLIPSREIINKMINMGVKKQKVFYLPPGINTANFKPKITQTQARKKLGLPKNLIIMTYFGALTEEKGIFDIVQAVRALSKETQKKILIVLFCYYLKGFSNHKNMVKKIKEGTPKNVKIYEKYVDVPLLLTACDYIIYPQQTGHGTTIPPISILEGLAAQKPIITTRILGIRELITKNNGILLPPASPIDLAKTMERVLHKTPRFTQNSNIDSFSLENVTNRLLSIYKQVHEK